MTLDYASIGLRIRNARTKVDMTQDSFAEALHISRRHLSLLENGDRGISLELLVDIANVLNVPIAELLTDNLGNVDTIEDSDFRYILLDCSATEEKIITKTAKALKAALIEHGV